MLPIIDSTWRNSMNLMDFLQDNFQVKSEIKMIYNLSSVLFRTSSVSFVFPVSPIFPIFMIIRREMKKDEAIIWTK